MIEIITDTIIDALKLFPFLFIAFLIIEYIEHKLTNKSKKIIEKSEKMGPLIGSALGIIPQCGFSVLATNLYITRIISLGTLISIYLSTSDEMLPILLSEKTSINTILQLLLIKFVIGLIAGFLIDFIIRKLKIKKTKKENYSICQKEHCHCENNNLLLSSLKHTSKTLLFIVLLTFILNVIMKYLGNEYISKIFMKNSIFSPFLSSLVGLIPNCGASVILTELYIKGIIETSSVVSGLLTGSGVALLVLFKTNKNLKENITILSLIYFIGSFSGLIIEILERIL